MGINKIEITGELRSVTSDVLALNVAAVLIEKQGIDVAVYDVRQTASITDFYVIASGKSPTHVAALADDVDYNVGLRGRAAERIEGRRANNWILVDYLDVIVHIFDRESRDFYNFERLMPQEGRVDLTDVIKAVDEKLGIK